MAALAEHDTSLGGLMDICQDTVIAVTITTESGERKPCVAVDERWKAGDVSVSIQNGKVTIQSPETALSWVRIRWAKEALRGAMYCGDQWERGYGDHHWRILTPERALPWYALVRASEYTYGIGVKTGPHAFCSWFFDAHGVDLLLDVRNGGSGVRLGKRILEACEIVCYNGTKGEAVQQVAQSFARKMCDTPICPDHIVYGSNNWYYAYGVSSHSDILKDTDLLMELTEGIENPPYMVIDSGWQYTGGGYSENPNAALGCQWTKSNKAFPDMAGLASEIAEKGARPGIWMRPMLADPETDPKEWCVPVERIQDMGVRGSFPLTVYDPSHPEALARIQSNIQCIAGWGYELIKHDFSTFDIFGLWGCEANESVTNDGWSFYDRTKTSAEIILDLYRAIREGAGSAVLIGCNTVSHLAAGLVEIQRTGTDTSGLKWEETRKQGVNTLAYRLHQHEAFYQVDADCVGITAHVPWEKNKQWLQLLSESGTPLFVSAAPEAIGEEQRAALKKAYAIASQAQPLAIAQDWCDTSTPSHWVLLNHEVVFDWYDG